MGKSWLMCVLLGTLAWGQAAPGGPPPAAPGSVPLSPMASPQAAAADTAASVPDDAAVITVIGVCPEQTANGNAAHAQSTPAIDCKTVITKAQFETLANNLAPNITPQQKKQLAGWLPKWIAMSDQAEKKGLDKTSQFEYRFKISRMQLLSQMLQQDVQKEAAEIPQEEIEKYYKEHAESFEQFNVDRLFVPRTKQGEAEAAEDDEKDEKLSEQAKKTKEAEEKAKADKAEQAMTKLAESLRTRAAAGEDFIKLQKEAFNAAGMKIESPTVNLPNVRRTGLPAGHVAVFDLKPGEVSQVISDAGGHYIYKVNHKDHVALDQATNEIHSKLQNDRTREMMEKLNNSFKVETNDAYFGPGGVGTAPPPRPPHPRQAPMPSPPAAQPQAPPPAQPPAAKPN